MSELLLCLVPLGLMLGLVVLGYVFGVVRESLGVV